MFLFIKWVKYYYIMNSLNCTYVWKQRLIIYWKNDSTKIVVYSKKHLFFITLKRFFVFKSPIDLCKTVSVKKYLNEYSGHVLQHIIILNIINPYLPSSTLQCPNEIMGKTLMTFLCILHAVRSVIINVLCHSIKIKKIKKLDLIMKRLGCFAGTRVPYLSLFEQTIDNWWYLLVDRLWSETTAFDF